MDRCELTFSCVVISLAGFLKKVFSGGSRARQATIYLIDDSDVFLELLKIQINKIVDAHLVLFTFPSHMLEFSAQDGKPPDLVISDVNMPGFNGFQLKRKAHQLWQVKVPFIFVTGLEGDDETDDDQELVMISKPVDAELLKKEISRFLPEDQFIYR